jgi:hypothetical protein
VLIKEMGFPNTCTGISVDQFPDTCTGIGVDQRNAISKIHVQALVLIKEMGFPDTCTGISVDQRNGISRYMYWH